VSQNQATELKKLQKIWYARLKKKGFEDIERNETELKVYSENIIKNAARGRKNINHEIWCQSKTEYFRMAEHFLNENKFENKILKYIWDLHSQGVSARNISKKLKSLKIKKDKTTVHRIVQNLAKQMFEKYGVSSRG